MNKIRIIGDVHGKYDRYIDIASQSDYSLQIGDMGFRYDAISVLPSTQHVFFKGNHDNYSLYSDNQLGDYGEYVLGGFKFFYIRGGHSIDKKYRKLGIDFWQEEELSVMQASECVRLYNKIKPDFVIAHECPLTITDLISDPKMLSLFGYSSDWKSWTSKLLQVLIGIHMPKTFIFGHHHKSWTRNIDGCDFICLNELEYKDIYV